MINKDNLVTGLICGVISVAFIWSYMFFTKSDEETMHQMHDSSMEMGSMTMDEMVSMMNGKTGKDLEKEFLTGMIPHHQGAVDMAEVLLADETTSPQIRMFAAEIIRTQEAEIQLMKDWLKAY